MKRTSEEPVYFRGAPRSVRGFVRVPYGEMGVSPRHVVLVEGARHTGPIAVQTLARGPVTDVRFALASATPPGQYRGTLTLGEREYGVVARIDGRTRLVAMPPRFDLVGEPGARERESVSMLNDGNVAVTIEKTYAVGLFETSGLDRAIGKAFRHVGGEGKSRIEAFFDAAAEGYGGIVRIAVDEGAGVLHPGDVRELALTLHLPDRMRGDRSYFGYLTVANLVLPVFVHGAGHAVRSETSA